MRRLTGVLVLCVALLLAGCGGGGGGSDRGSGASDVEERTDEPDEPSESDLMAEEASAYDACKEFVEARLKAPSTAEFPDYWDQDDEVRVAGVGEDMFTIQSHVDAENGFGAQIQTQFVCEVRDRGDRWRLVDLRMDGA